MKIAVAACGLVAINFHGCKDGKEDSDAKSGKGEPDAKSGQGAPAAKTDQGTPAAKNGKNNSETKSGNGEAKAAQSKPQGKKDPEACKGLTFENFNTKKRCAECLDSYGSMDKATVEKKIKNKEFSKDDVELAIEESAEPEVNCGAEDLQAGVSLIYWALYVDSNPEAA